MVLQARPRGRRWTPVRALLWEQWRTTWEPLVYFWLIVGVWGMWWWSSAPEKPGLNYFVVDISERAKLYFYMLAGLLSLLFLLERAAGGNIRLRVSQRRFLLPASRWVLTVSPLTFYAVMYSLNVLGLKVGIEYCLRTEILDLWLLRALSGGAVAVAMIWGLSWPRLRLMYALKVLGAAACFDGFARILNSTEFHPENFALLSMACLVFAGASVWNPPEASMAWPKLGLVNLFRPRKARRFRTRLGAQLWYEWRTWGWILPAVSICLGVVLYLSFNFTGYFNGDSTIGRTTWGLILGSANAALGFAPLVAFFAGLLFGLRADRSVFRSGLTFWSTIPRPLPETVTARIAMWLLLCLLFVIPNGLEVLNSSDFRLAFPGQLGMSVWVLNPAAGLLVLFIPALDSATAMMVSPYISVYVCVALAIAATGFVWLEGAISKRQLLLCWLLALPALLLLESGLTETQMNLSLNARVSWLAGIIAVAAEADRIRRLRGR